MASEKLNIRVSSEIHARLTREAADQGVTLSAYSAALIERALGVEPQSIAVTDQGEEGASHGVGAVGGRSALQDLVERLEVAAASLVGAGAGEDRVSAVPKLDAMNEVSGPDPVAFRIEMLMLMRSMALSPASPDLNVRVAETIRQQLGARRRWGY